MIAQNTPEYGSYISIYGLMPINLNTVKYGKILRHFFGVVRETEEMNVLIQ